MWWVAGTGPPLGRGGQEVIGLVVGAKVFAPLSGDQKVPSPPTYPPGFMFPQQRAFSGFPWSAPLGLCMQEPLAVVVTWPSWKIRWQHLEDLCDSWRFFLEDSISFPGRCNIAPLTESLTQHRFTLLPFWRPEVGHEGVIRAPLLCRPWGRLCSRTLSLFLLASRLMAASLQTCHSGLPACVSVSSCAALRRTPVMLD